MGGINRLTTRGDPMDPFTINLPRLIIYPWNIHSGSILIFGNLSINPLVICYIAMENGPRKFVGFHINSIGFFHTYVSLPEDNTLWIHLLSADLSIYHGWLLTYPWISDKKEDRLKPSTLESLWGIVCYHLEVFWSLLRQSLDPFSGLRNSHSYFHIRTVELEYWPKFVWRTPPQFSRYPLVTCDIANWKITISFMGKLTNFLW